MIKRRILIVEDDLSICRSMEEHLQNDSTDVCCVTTVADALDIFMTHEYCLVIIDFQVSGDICSKRLVNSLIFR